MTTVIRPEISRKNKYWIDKHRHYELKHFCLQYPKWKSAYRGYPSISSSVSERLSSSISHSDPTARHAMRQVDYIERIRLVERVAEETDMVLQDYILKGVTEGVSYTYLRTKLNMPCSRDMYYDRYRRFFWLLDNERG